MKSSIRLLTIILFVQVIASVLLFSSGENLAAFKAEEPLLDLSLNDLTEIKITVKEKSTGDREIVLANSDGTWVMPNYYNFPVAERKLDSFSETLFTMKRPFPVGSSETAARQFELTKDKFQTKIEFKKGDKVKQILYLGSSPSFKKVHARTDDNYSSYAVNFSSYELRGKDRVWIDKEHLKIDFSDIKQIAFANYTIVQSEDKGSFTLSDLNQETEEISAKGVMDLVKDTTGPGFIDILGTEAKDEYNLRQPVIEYTVTLQDGSEKTYSYGDVKEESHYILKLSDEPFYFKVSGYQVGKFKDINRAVIVRAKAEKKEEPVGIPMVDGKLPPVGEAARSTEASTP